MTVPEPFECPQLATVAPILVHLSQAGTWAGAVLWWQGVCSGANHTGASSICHLHFFSEYSCHEVTDLSAGSVCLWPILVCLCH